MPSRPLQALGVSIRDRRKSLGVSQEKLAHAAGASQSYVSSLECGRRNPSFLSLLRIARALKTTPAELLGGLR
ncbi:MAG: helix-turn-helix transcriptional regulator [Planctomycetes bacterium]|nr:helix-turn-helix transcriptional regulator [Planctomycetota bacterium]